MDVEMDNFNDGTTGSWEAHSSTISNENDRLKVTLSDAEVGVYKIVSVTAGEALTINLEVDKGTTDKVSLYEYTTGKLSDLVDGHNQINYTPTVSGDFILLIVKDPTSIDVGTQTHFYLDNIGVTIGEDELVIVEENNFYPFGLKHKGYNNVVSANTNSAASKYKYNGKELQDELGLNWLDYGWRNYDPAIGRWMKIDPLAATTPSWSPYNYVENTPVNAIDPDGLSCVGCGPNGENYTPPTTQFGESMYIGANVNGSSGGCCNGAGDNGQSMTKGITLNEVVITASKSGSSNGGGYWSSEGSEYSESFSSYKARYGFSGDYASVNEQYTSKYGNSYKGAPWIIDATGFKESWDLGMQAPGGTGMAQYWDRTFGGLLMGTMALPVASAGAPAGYYGLADKSITVAARIGVNVIKLDAQLASYATQAKVIGIGTFSQAFTRSRIGFSGQRFIINNFNGTINFMRYHYNAPINTFLTPATMDNLQKAYDTYNDFSDLFQF